jgi:hypothetical protein
MASAGGHRFRLETLPERLAVCRLDPGSPVPPWAWSGPFQTVTRTADELSIVCAEAAVPAAVRRDAGWRALRIAGTLPFDIPGVMAGLATAIAASGISLFAISTFDTDYILVKEPDLDGAVAALRAAGHEVRTEPATP